jgi:hypothetical protein
VNTFDELRRVTLSPRSPLPPDTPIGRVQRRIRLLRDRRMGRDQRPARRKSLHPDAGVKRG